MVSSRRIVRNTFIFSGLILAWFDSSIAAGRVKLDPVRDNTLIESSTGAVSNGSGPHIFAGRNSGETESIRRAVLQFDVAGSIPRGSRIVGAVLTLNMCQGNVGERRVSLHRIVADWGEGASESQGGGGAPSEPDDATWIHTFHEDGFWAHAGGDFVASSASVVIDAPAFYAWGPTRGMTADVQRWLDDPASNHGWLLRGDESEPSTAKRFDSRENEAIGLRPKLVVDFVRATVEDRNDRSGEAQPSGTILEESARSERWRRNRR